MIIPQRLQEKRKHWRRLDIAEFPNSTDSLLTRRQKISLFSAFHFDSSFKPSNYSNRSIQLQLKMMCWKLRRRKIRILPKCLYSCSAEAKRTETTLGIEGRQCSSVSNCKNKNNEYFEREKNRKKKLLPSLLLLLLLFYDIYALRGKERERKSVFFLNASHPNVTRTHFLPTALKLEFCFCSCVRPECTNANLQLVQMHSHFIFNHMDMAWVLFETEHLSRSSTIYRLISILHSKTSQESRRRRWEWTAVIVSCVGTNAWMSPQYNCRHVNWSSLSHLRYKYG